MENEELKEASKWVDSIDINDMTIEEICTAYYHHRLDTAWVSVKEGLPEPLRQVLTIVKYEHGTTIVMAEYVPPKTVLAEDFVNEECGEGLDEYDEEKDCYWTKEGWFEWQHEAEIHYLICGDVIYWQPLPQHNLKTETDKNDFNKLYQQNCLPEPPKEK